MRNQESTILYCNVLYTKPRKASLLYESLSLPVLTVLYNILFCLSVCSELAVVLGAVFMPVVFYLPHAAVEVLLPVYSTVELFPELLCIWLL